MKHRLEILGITYNQVESGVYALVLKESEGTRRVPIIIGFPEAQSIECWLQQIKTPRPMTHDLVTTIMDAYRIKLEEVLIHQLPNGVFAADMKFNNGVEEITIDARSSDAIAIAIRCGAPIYCTDAVMDNASFSENKTASEANAIHTVELTSNVKSNDIDIKLLSTDELQSLLSEAVENENYEEAAKIKKELDSRIV